MIKRGETATVEIERFGDRGKSIAHVDRLAIMVNGGVPGDKAVIKVRRKKRRYAEADIVEVLENSPMRTDPRCGHFGTCGGCKWQHVEYQAQLEAKRQSVEDALSRLGGIKDAIVHPPVAADEIYYYRNKMEYSFGNRRWLTYKEIESGVRFDESVYGGFHVSGNYEKILDLNECHLQDPISYEILEDVRRLAKEQGWTAWDVRNQTGFLRHLVIRTSAQTGDVMVNIVTNGAETDRMTLVSDLLRKEHPRVTTFVNTINTGLAQTAYGERTDTIFGPGTIIDRIGKYEFEISPGSFFQTNTRQAEKLYDVILDVADLKSEDLVYDLYCGGGTISLYLSEYVREVIGVEVIESAVENAKANIRHNNVSNCTFILGDMLKVITPGFFEEHGNPDVIVLDPPRAGIHPKVVQRLSDLRPDKIVYVSCNPRTQARDLQLMGDNWETGPSQPVDMFPHTHHIENVLLLTPRN